MPNVFNVRKYTERLAGKNDTESVFLSNFSKIEKGKTFRYYLLISLYQSFNSGAENGTQTRDPQLGRLVLYKAVKSCAFARFD